MCLKNIIEQIAKKESAYNRLTSNAFSQLSFDERLMLFRLKAELAQLSLLVVNEVTDHVERGKYLRKVVNYVPYHKQSHLRPHLYPSTLLPKTKKSSEAAWATVQDITLGIVSLFIIPSFPLAITYYMFVKAPEVDRLLTNQYIKQYCLFDINDEMTSEDCLSSAVAYFDSQNYYISIRYLLEAEKRSPVTNDEINHYFFLCFFHLLGPQLTREYLAIMYSEDKQIKNNDISNIVASILIIKNTVKPVGELQFCVGNNHTLTKVIDNNFNLYTDNNSFRKNLIGHNPSGFDVTAVELAQHLESVLYDAFADLDPRTDQYKEICIKVKNYMRRTHGDCNKTLQSIGLTQLTAYMSQLCELPLEILDAGCAHYFLLPKHDEYDDQAFLHLLLLREKLHESIDTPQGTALTYLPSQAKHQNQNRGPISPSETFAVSKVDGQNDTKVGLDHS